MPYHTTKRKSFSILQSTFLASLIASNLLQVAQPTPADFNGQNVADGPHSISVCSPFDYINDRVENVSNSVDKKGEENDGCNLASAPFAAAAAASKIQENVSSTISASAADAAVGGVFYARKVLSDDEDDEFIAGWGGGEMVRVLQSSFTCNRPVGSLSDGYISSRQRLQKCHRERQNLPQKLQRCQQSRPVTAAMDCTMEVNFENITLQPHLQFGVEQNCAPGDVLAKFRRQCNESVAKNFDHRIRYGLSSLETYSKYSSRRNDTGISGRSENGFWSGSEEKITCGASTAATFFARYVLTYS